MIDIDCELYAPHQIVVIGIAAIAPHNAMADSLMDEISAFVEGNTEAEILEDREKLDKDTEKVRWLSKKSKSRIS